MQKKELGLATAKVADIRLISGRATAEESNRDLQTGKGRSLGRITCSTLLGPLIGVGILTALIPMSTSAQTISAQAISADAGGVPADIAALQAQVAALQTQVNTLQNQLTSVLALAPFVSVDPNPENGVIGPHITFKGANIHIISGMGATNDNGSRSGLGNLIIWL